MNIKAGWRNPPCFITPKPILNRNLTPSNQLENLSMRTVSKQKFTKRYAP